MKPSDLTNEARVGYEGGINPHILTSPAWYAHMLGRYLHQTGRCTPTDVRMGRGNSIRANGMRFAFVDTYSMHKASIVFERVE